MQRWRATLTYDGTPYNGWQIQPTHPTVQGSLAAALHHLTGETTLPQGAGRTDTGVHALAQVAHFDLAAPIPPENLHRALNRSLPPSIRILTLALCPPDFHARHAARSKTYEYRILPRAHDRETICPPFLAPFVWPCPRVLDVDLLNQAATQILGTHDFTTFAAVNPDQSTRETVAAEEDLLSRPEDLSSFRNAGGSAFSSATKLPCNTRTILSSHWHLDHSSTLLYRVTGTGFLHHMVRNLVGTFTEQARFPPACIPTILAGKDRQLAGPTAPPQGLFLAEVHY